MANKKVKNIKTDLERFIKVIKCPNNYGIPNLKKLQPKEIHIDCTKNKYKQHVIYLYLGNSILIFTEKNVFDYRYKYEIDELSNDYEFNFKFQSMGFKDWCRCNRIIKEDYTVIVLSLCYAFNPKKIV